jgi:hypothetical protein
MALIASREAAFAFWTCPGAGHCGRSLADTCNKRALKLCFADLP